MIMDDRNLFSDKQAVTAIDFSDFSLDLGQEGVIYDGTQILKRKGVAEHIPLYIGVNTAFVSGGASTDMTIEIQEGTGVDGAGDLNAGVSSILSVTVPIADLVAGYIFPVDKLPRKVTKRYLQFKFTAVGGPFASGNISAGFVAAVDGMNKSNF